MYRGKGGGGGEETILTMTITIDNYWLDLIIVKESYCGRVLNGRVHTDRQTDLHCCC
jgi:hypothetical protein